MGEAEQRLAEGFIGTVIGIAFALDYAASLDNPQDPTLLAEITGRLGRGLGISRRHGVGRAILAVALAMVKDSNC